VHCADPPQLLVKPALLAFNNSIAKSPLINALNDKETFKSFKQPLQVDDAMLVLDEDLRPAACGLASALRSAGRVVDVQLEPRRKMKAAIKAAERAGAARLLIVGGDEWARGAVAVRDLGAFEQKEVPVEELVAQAQAQAATDGA